MTNSYQGVGMIHSALHKATRERAVECRVHKLSSRGVQKSLIMIMEKSLLLEMTWTSVDANLV
jgi:hypothetical protein